MQQRFDLRNLLWYTLCDALPGWEDICTDPIITFADYYSRLKPENYSLRQ